MSQHAYGWGAGAGLPPLVVPHFSVSVMTSWRYMKAGEALDAGRKANRNLTGLATEQLEQQRTPGPAIDWNQDASGNVASMWL